MAYKNTKKNAPAEPKGNPPVDKIRVGSVTASIWENTNDGNTFLSATFERRYRTGEEWKTSHSYGPSDLLELAKAADLAHTRIIEVLNGGNE